MERRERGGGSGDAAVRRERRNVVALQMQVPERGEGREAGQVGERGEVVVLQTDRRERRHRGDDGGMVDRADSWFVPACREMREGRSGRRCSTPRPTRGSVSSTASSLTWPKDGLLPGSPWSSSSCRTSRNRLPLQIVRGN